MKNLFYAFLFYPLLLSAQNHDSDTLKLKADLSVTGFWQGGNVQTVIFRAKSEVSYRPWQKWDFRTRNSYVYQEFGRQKADEDILSLNFLSYNPDRKIYPLILGFFSTNFRREIDQRYLVGGGVTFQILKKEKAWFRFSLTSEYEQTDFDRAIFNREEYNGNRTINTFRATLWVNGQHPLFKDKAILTHESYFQPSLERSNNFRWQTDVGLEFPVWKHVNLKVNYLHAHESIVIENQRRQDRFLTFGLTVKSY
jgi:hypothetical protein